MPKERRFANTIFREEGKDPPIFDLAEMEIICRAWKKLGVRSPPLSRVCQLIDNV